MTEPRRRRLALAGGSLRVRLTIAVVVVFAFALSLGAVLVVQAVEHTVVQAIESADREQLDRLRFQLEDGVAVEALELPADAPSYVAFGREGEAPVRLPTPPPWTLACAELPMDPALGCPLAPTAPPIEVTRAATPAPWSVVALPLDVPGEGQMLLFAASSLAEVRHSTQTLARVLWMVVPVLVVLIGAAAWLLTTRALAPVRTMTQRLTTISDAAGERLTVPRTADEIAELGRTMNAMLERLELGSLRQREFVSDASHELRSPIASVRTRLEVAMTYPERAAWPDVARDAMHDVDRLEALVGDLLLLARLDEPETARTCELDLDELVLAEAGHARRVAVDVRGVEPVRLHGAPHALTRLLRNLLDNAARYATRVEVTLQERDGVAVLRVDDDGPGIPPADRQRVFERFTRLAGARTRDEGGVGLGLALARRIAERHGGSIRVDDAPRGGARFEVRLPSRNSS